MLGGRAGTASSFVDEERCHGDAVVRYGGGGGGGLLELQVLILPALLWSNSNQRYVQLGSKGRESARTGKGYIGCTKF